jgi:hypothetical protein
MIKCEWEFVLGVNHYIEVHIEVFNPTTDTKIGILVFLYRPYPYSSIYIHNIVKKHIISQKSLQNNITFLTFK